MTDINAAEFTKEMAESYTILVPPMVPVHEKLFFPMMNEWGYHIKMMENSGELVMRKGLKYCHNDTCYPAQICIGEMMDAIESGEYDTNKLAFIITQTGGGCRASNYIALMRKALNNAGYGHIPVISMNFSRNLEHSKGFTLTLSMLYRMFYFMYIGDLLVTLKNQCAPYELIPGETQRHMDRWIAEVPARFGRYKKFGYGDIKKCYREIVEDFASIPRRHEQKPKVGIVGEIFVKFSPYGNNELENFLTANGAEPVLGGLADFCMYCVKNGMIDFELYKSKMLKGLGMDAATHIMMAKQMDVIKTIRKYSDFHPSAYFGDVLKATKGFINNGVKMGEGWLLTGEMLEFCQSGIKNIVCAQPFGCLPNHIVGKGMIKGVKALYSDANIVPIDYDFSSTRTNQENRIKLMLANAYKNMTAQSTIGTHKSAVNE